MSQEVNTNKDFPGIIPYFERPIKDRSKGIIKVIGVGGGGCNAVSGIYHEGIDNVTFAVCNTDSAVLNKSEVPVKLQLGTEGLGVGGDPSRGKAEAEKSAEDIKRLLDDGTKMVFVTAAMGGGTGTGSSPVVASIARSMGILTVGVVTIPFYFEKKKKVIKALKGVEEMRKNVDALLIVNNERLSDIYADSELTLKEAFRCANNILKDAVKGISELITLPSDEEIHSDFCDVETTIRNGGSAIMAMGRASGDHRVERAITDALQNPLVHGNDIEHAKRILFNIYTSDDSPLKIKELLDIDDFFAQLNPDIEVIWGTATDNSLGEDAKVTILASDVESHPERNQTDETEHDEEYYEELIKQLYRPIPSKEPIKQDPPFDIEVPKEPEAADTDDEDAEATDTETAEEHTGDNTNDKEPAAQSPASKNLHTILDKWKTWLGNIVAEE
ncbi:MAG: cell division protein FtsZ [Prevotella sp.]|nr:cell division protein FtsZ [Prevotella sp.]